jgi:hypothetical protein
MVFINLTFSKYIFYTNYDLFKQNATIKKSIHQNLIRPDGWN